ncbi:MAG: beta-galactosidase [FCB group bacterium]|jgi:hypothetical protein|nr:beta-galactosidase [FCB group bacterium]
MMGTIFVALAMLQGADAPERFVQDRFAIGFWVDPPADEKMAERYEEIADANFTVVLGGFGAKDAKTTKRQLALCKKHDLKALIWAVGMPAEELPEGSACWGYLVRDEPSAADFPVLRQRVDELRAAHPGKLAYINLFPDYASAKALGTDTYAEHVQRFLDEVDVDVLSMDYYPIFTPSADGRDGYCGNLELFRQESMRKGIPFWNFFNVMPYGPHTDPTEAQLRWQAFTSVAYGAKGVLYFCYWTPQGGEFPKGGAILRTDGTRTRHYEQAKRLNGALKSYGPTLMQLTSTGVRRVAPSADVAAAVAGSPIKSLVKAEVDPPLDLLVGTFKHADGRRAVMLNNYSVTYSSWPTVEFDAPHEKVVEIDPKTGREIALYDESPDMPGLQLSLDSGEGRLFLVP